jgi:hypothetical protein
VRPTRPCSWTLPEILRWKRAKVGSRHRKKGPLTCLFEIFELTNPDPEIETQRRTFVNGTLCVEHIIQRPHHEFSLGGL